LKTGGVFAVFPEGTTTDGSTLLRFHASLVEPAVQAQAAVQPFVVRYERLDGSLCTEAAFDGVRSVWDTVLGITSHEAIIARLSFLQPIRTSGLHRRELVALAREAISRTLSLRGPGNHIEPAGDLRAAAR
jgi:1-acyl-sn-glycerol-3-phosphate acyltransferase